MQLQLPFGSVCKSKPSHCLLLGSEGQGLKAPTKAYSFLALALYSRRRFMFPLSNMNGCVTAYCSYSAVRRCSANASIQNVLVWSLAAIDLAVIGLMKLP
uniref:Dolichol phosphate-mannose biosynthesis regulatory protein-related n=1 Tax=Arundo donax TaxID=35708 RepID=A0A0A9D6Z2_ARUDO